MGGCLGILELLRRVIPRDIVGENPNKLKRMDATVHIFYEVAGTAGAFASSVTIKAMGSVYAMIIMPILFFFAGLFWLRIRPKETFELKRSKMEKEKGVKRKNFFYLYYRSIIRGASIVFSERRFIWLVPGYVLPFFFHRFIENVIFPTFAKQVLLAGHLSGILLAGSNLGELFGALLVYLTASKIYTPLPWVRLDGIALMVLWVFPFLPISNSLQWVWSVFPLMIVLSAGWAAGDVSLLAYIQSRLHHISLKEEEGISPLGCVMAFLYSSYIASFVIISIPLGKVFDQYNLEGRVRESFIYISGVMFVIGGIIIFACTFIPRGSFSLNPKISDDDNIAEEAEDEKGGTPTLVEAISEA